MVEVDTFANGMVGKPCITKKKQETNQASPLGLTLTYLLKLVMVVKSSTPQVKCLTQITVYINLLIHIIWVN